MQDSYDPYAHRNDDQHNQYYQQSPQQPQYTVESSPSNNNINNNNVVSPQSISSPTPYDYNNNNQYSNSNSNNHSHGHHHHHNRLGHPQPYYASYSEINSKQDYNNSNNINYNNYYQQQQQQQQQYNNNDNNNNFYQPQQQQQQYFNNINGGNVTIQLLINNLLNDNDAKKLAIWIVVMLIFTLYEIFYGAYLESLGLVSDGFHTLFDCIGLIISLMGMIFGRKTPNQDYTYGYDRWEVLGTFANCCFLLFVSFFLFLESIERLLEPPHIHDHGRVISLAFVSLIINLLGLFFFKRQQQHSMDSNRNSKGLLSSRNMNLLTITNHILVDSCTSLGVIFSSLLGKTMGLEISDSLISLIIAAIIVYDVLPVALRTAKTLLQTTPDTIKLDIDSAVMKIQKIDGVLDCSERHFWAHSGGQYIGSINVVIKSTSSENEISSIVRRYLSFIQDLTVQVEREHSHSHNHSHNQEQLKEHKYHNHDHNHHEHDDHHDHNHDQHEHEHEHEHHGHSHNHNQHGHSHNHNQHGHSHDHGHEHHNHTEQEEEVPQYQVQQEDSEEIEHNHQHHHDEEEHHNNDHDHDHDHDHGHSHNHHGHSHSHNHSHNTDGWGDD